MGVCIYGYIVQFSLSNPVVEEHAFFAPVTERKFFALAPDLAPAYHTLEIQRFGARIAWTAD